MVVILALAAVAPGLRLATWASVISELVPSGSSLLGRLRCQAMAPSQRAPTRGNGLICLYRLEAWAFGPIAPAPQVGLGFFGVRLVVVLVEVVAPTGGPCGLELHRWAYEPCELHALPGGEIGHLLQPGVAGSRELGAALRVGAPYFVDRFGILGHYLVTVEDDLGAVQFG